MFVARQYSSGKRLVRAFPIRCLASSRKLEHNEIIIKSKYPEVGRILDVSISEYIRSFALNFKWKESVAFEDGLSGAKIRHDEVFRNARNFTAALQQSGLRRGDIVGLVLPNNIHYSSMLFGIMDAGLVATTVNPGYSAEEMLRQVEDAECKCVVTIPDFVPILRNFQQNNPNLKHLIVLGEAMEGCHTYSEMIKVDGSNASILSGLDIDTSVETALLPFSSGTTGKPKGVCLTQSNMVTQLAQLLTPGTITLHPYTAKDDRVIGLLPMFHMYGLITFCFIGHLVGAHVLCLPRFDPVSFLNAVRRHKPTVLHLVTPLILHMTASPEYGTKEFESVDTIVATAAPIGPFLIENILKKAQKYIFFQEGYGMTESTAGCTLLAENTQNKKTGSCGQLVASTMGKVVSIDESGKTLGPNERGELWVKGPQIMKGYWKNEQATRETIDADGWLRTGDIGYYDENEYFYIVDRLKELIKVKGLQVAPAELEDLLRQHPNIIDAAVIGIPHPETGELPRGYIVSTDQNLTADAVHHFLKGRISRFKELKGGIEFISAIPKSPSGKILRRVLKVEYCQKNGIPI